MELTISQKNISNDIIKIGLSKAAESLSFFMKHNIKIEGNDFNIVDLKTSKPTINGNETLKVLVTELMGELKGASYLVFTNEEAQQLYKQCLPADVLNNETKLAAMADAILLEVDNIISASVITQFSNILKLKIFGGVPKLVEANSNEIADLVTLNLTQNAYLLSVKAKFTSDEINFNPEFFWLLDKKFFESIILLEQQKNNEKEH